MSKNIILKKTHDNNLWEVDGTETQLKTSKDIDMQTKKIINVVDPTSDQEATTKKYVDDTHVPAGSEGEVQFNESSQFQADANLFWDNVNKRLGIGTVSPTAELDINGNLLVQDGKITGDNGSFLTIGSNTGEFMFNNISGTNRWLTIHTANVTGTDAPYLSAANSRIQIGANIFYIGAGKGPNFTGTDFSHHKGHVRFNGSIFEISSLDGTVDANTKILAGDILLMPTGNVGIGTTTPTQPLSVEEKSCMTAIGGFAIKLTNKTGANSVAGNLVQADSANNDAVSLSPAGNVDTIGVFLEAGVSDGTEAWVVISGIADVALDDNVSAVRGNWMGAGVLAGYATTSGSPPAAPTHFEEIGHCIETVAAGGAGTHILARCVLHFN